MFGGISAVVLVDHVERDHGHALRGELARDPHVGVARECVVGPSEQRHVHAIRMVLDLAQDLAAELSVRDQEPLVLPDADIVRVAALGAGETELLGDVLERLAAHLEVVVAQRRAADAGSAPRCSPKAWRAK